ncbi:hypothetical protein HK102_011397, partial [Quaeritorhiza haematococci]
MTSCTKTKTQNNKEEGEGSEEDGVGSKEDGGMGSEEDGGEEAGCGEEENGEPHFVIKNVATGQRSLEREDFVPLPVRTLYWFRIAELISRSCSTQDEAVIWLLERCRDGATAKEL